jgi:hypothetical protein
VTGEQWRDERMLEWLESGPSDVPVEPLEAAIAYARTHPRRRLSGAGLRRFLMSQVHLTAVKPPTTHRSWAAVLAAAAVVVVVVVGGAALIARNNGDSPAGVGAPAPSATALPTQAPPSTQTPAPTVSPPTVSPPPPAGLAACTVATLAGKPGSPGAVDGPAEAARFSTEVGFPTFDRAGVLFMADAGNNAIRNVTKDGMVTTFAGALGEAGSADGKGSAARFNRPVGLGFDGDGFLYVADNENHTIRKIAPDGTVTTLAGKAGEAGQVDGVGGAARFRNPWSIAVDAAGNVYVGEDNGNAIRRVAPDGTVTTLAGNPKRYGYAIDGVGPEAGFGWPFGLALGPDGTLYVVDVSSNLASVLRTVAPDGTVTTVDADWAGSLAASIWVDPSGVVFNASFPSGTVAKLSSDGTVTLLAGQADIGGSRDGTGDIATFSDIVGIVGDASGTLYVGDSGNSTIRTIRCP